MRYVKLSVSRLGHSKRNLSYPIDMASTAKIPTISSKSLTVAIKRAMALRDMRPRELAKASGVPFGTLRRILELNTVADYEQLSKISDALKLPISQIAQDAEDLCKDKDFIADWREENNLGTAPDDADAALASAADDSAVPDMSGWSADEQAAYVVSHLDQFDVAAKKGDIEREQTEYEDLP